METKKIGESVSFDEFVERAIQTHRDTYVYTPDSYDFISKKVGITCKQHGMFWQIGLDHVNGRGCPTCGKHLAKEIQKRNRKSTEEFIQQCIAVYGDKYDYSATRYVTAKIPISVICKTHGKFERLPNHFLEGHECPKCLTRHHKYTQDQFLAKAKEIHGSKYDYSKVEYVNQKVNIEIICKKHGAFYQNPYNHMKGSGCVKCGYEKNGLYSCHGWIRKKYIEQNKGKLCTFYIVKLWEGDVEFVKVGITSGEVWRRFFPCKIPLKHEVIYVTKGSPEFIWDLEKEILEFGYNRYFPNTNFSGKTECFKLKALDSILAHAFKNAS